MKNIDNWIPTKFEFRKGKLRASRNLFYVMAASRLPADIIAEFYSEQIPKFVKGKLLDLGCGNVPLYEAYRPFISSNICLDWANSSLPNQYLDFEADLNETLNLPDNEVDTIILSDVLEHIRNPEKLWQEMFRVLSYNGHLILNVPYYYWLHDEPFDYFRYTKHALKYMAEKCGFQILLLEPFGGAPEVLTDICCNLIVNVRYLGNPIVFGLQSLIWRFIHSKIGKKISRKTSNQFPFGYIMVTEKPQQVKFEI